MNTLNMENNIKELLKKSFDEMMPLSQRWKKEELMHRYTLELAQKYLNNFSGKKVLDIGCGLGVVINALKVMGAQVEGIDKYILEEWGINGIEELWQVRGLNIIVDDFFVHNFEDNKYDLIFSENVLEHLPYSQKEFLDKINYLLAPGGIVIITTPNLATLIKRSRLLRGKTVYWDFNDFYLNKQPYGHIREFTGNELREMAKHSGLNVLNVEYKNIYWKKRWIKSFKKLPYAINYFLSQFLPSSRDNVFLIAQKN